MSIEAMKLAMEAMALCLERGMDETAIDRCVTATEALRAAIKQAEKRETCLDCERYKLSASMWRNEAYKHAGTALPWEPEELLRKEYERGVEEGKKRERALWEMARLGQEMEQEPVAWADKYDIEREGHDFYVNRQQPARDGVPLYTAPQQREAEKKEIEPDKDCVENDGCPTEKSVLQRFWREHQQAEKREWVGLTDKEYEAMAEQHVTNCYFDTLSYAKAIEARLKEKNNG